MAAELPPRPPAGFVLVDKPAGETSHTTVSRIRRAHGMRGGHAGTLDPFATGLLIVLLGRATRLQRYVLGLDKTYLATARLGWRSSTGDPEGELEHTGAVPGELRLPVGRIRQRVPLTSAVKVGGERLYKRAHRGESAERPVREVTVHAARLLSSDGERARFEIRCSSGTYIRTLVEELGDAYCEALRRTAIGRHSVDDAGDEVRPPESLVGHLPERDLSEGEALDVVHGRRIEARGEPEGAPLRLIAGERLLAVAHREGEVLKTEVVLA